MPGTVQVHAGDTVEWMGGVTAPHTVTFLKGRNFAAHGFVVPDPKGGVYPESLDAAGVPFPDSGQPKLVYNVGILPPTRGAAITGGRLQSSGLFGPEFGRATASFRFPRVGVYRYNCLLHPGMQGTIVVKPKGTAVPTPEAVTQRAERIQARGWKAAARLLTAKVPANTVLNGPAAIDGSGDVNLFVLRPARLRVKAGTTVSFPNKSPVEVHNLVFGRRSTSGEDPEADGPLPAGAGRSGTRWRRSSPFASDNTGSRTPTPGKTMHGNGFFVTQPHGRSADRAPARVPGDLLGTGDVQVLLLDPRARYGRGRSSVTP